MQKWNFLENYERYFEYKGVIESCGCHRQLFHCLKTEKAHQKMINLNCLRQNKQNIVFGERCKCGGFHIFFINGLIVHTTLITIECIFASMNHC